MRASVCSSQVHSGEKRIQLPLCFSRGVTQRIGNEGQIGHYLQILARIGNNPSERGVSVNVRMRRSTAMLTTKPSALRLVWLCLILAQGWCVSPLSNGFASQQERGRIEPVLRLEKPRYVEGEAVRFWVGVKPQNSQTIPQELRKPCSLSITKPDGTRRVDSVGWPVDGAVDRGWSGGWGFGDERVEPGI